MDWKQLIKKWWFWGIIILILIILFFPMFNCQNYGFPSGPESGPIGRHCQSLIDLILNGKVYVE